jgi:hypothetical protein
MSHRSRVLSWLTSSLALSLAACSSCGGAAPATSASASAPSAASGGATGEGPRLPGPLVLPIPEGGSATPATIVVASDARAPLALDTTFGALDSLSLGARDQPLGLLELDSPDDPSGFPRACACPCGEGACAECERPEDRSLALPPGGRVELAWNGLVRRYRAGPQGTCFDTFAPPPGRYVLRVCSGSPNDGHPGPCGRAEITLPASGPITLRVSDALELARCPLAPDVLDRAARAALSHMERGYAVPERRARCVPEAECYAETDLPYGEDVVRGLRHTRDPSAPPEPPRGCGVLVAPRGDRLLVRVLLPLPDGFQGGERFDHELDVDATRIYSVRYEQ